MQRVPAFEKPPPIAGDVQAAAYGGDCLILGTDSGAIVSFVWQTDSWTPSASRQTKKDVAVAKLVTLDGVNRMMALTQTRTVSGYLLESLENFSKLSMRDVTDIVTELSANKQKPRQQVAIFTSSAIRFLDITEDSIYVARSIDYPGLSAGCWADTKFLLATQETYELLDLNKDSKIPLFPVAPNLPPILDVVGGNEFFVVQGTGKDDVAMGLIVTEEGEVSRQGDVVMWDSYPDSAVVVCGSFLLSIIGSQLLIHSLRNEIELIEHDFGDRPVQKVFPLHGPHLCDQRMTAKIGSECKSQAQALIVYQDKSIDWWIPPSNFVQLETRILENELHEISPELVNIDSEQGLLELEYLSLLLAMHLLARKEYSKAVGAWLDGVKLDPKVAFYLFADTDKLPESVAPGLRDFAEKLRVELPQDADAAKFYRTYLRALLKRLATLSAPVAAQTEQVYASKLQGQSLVDFVAKQATSSFEKLVEKFRQDNQFDALEKIYLQRNMSTELVALWSDALSGSTGIDTHEAAIKLSKLLTESEDEELVWCEALKLVTVDPQMGVDVFKHSKVSFDENKVLNALKQESDLAWRSYLKHLVYDLKKPSYTVDLTTILATDLVQGCKIPQISKFLEKLYKEYTTQAQPKRAFYPYLEKRRAQLESGTPVHDYLQLEIDFWDLICRPEADLASLTAMLDEHAPQLIIERSAIYSYLGLHTQCIELLVEINDYESLLYYCEYGRPAPPSQVSLDKQRPRVQLDVTQEVFRQLARRKQNAALVGDFLRRKRAEISLELALEHLPDDWPSHEFTGFFAYHVARLSNRQRQSMLLRGVSKAENHIIASELDYRLSE